MGVLWHHSSVNLVEPQSIALAAAHVPRRLPEIDPAVSIPACPPQQPQQPHEEEWLALTSSISH